MAQKNSNEENGLRKPGCFAVRCRIALAASLVVSTGCVHVRPAHFVIPARCVAVSIQSFTEPCLQRDDGKLICNGVVITATCVTPLVGTIPRKAGVR